MISQHYAMITFPRFISSSVVALIPAAVVLLMPLYTFASDGISVKVQPSIVEERVDAGAVLEGSLTITNENGGTQTYRIGVRDIDSMEANGRPIFSRDPADDPLRLAAWIEPLQDSVTIEVGGSANVGYRIVVPADASPGSHAAAIFVIRDAEGEAENGAGVGFNVGTLVNLRVNGEVVDDMVLHEFSTDRSLYTEPSVNFSTRVENTGTIYQKPRGVITVRNMLGKEVGEIVFNEKQQNAILPRSGRTFTAEWNLDSFAFGRYTALVNVGYGDTAQKTLKREVTFWILPWKEIGIVAGAFAALAMVVMFVLRSYIKRELKRAGHTAAKRVTRDLSFAERLSRVLVWLIVVLLLVSLGTIVFFQ